YPIRKFVKRRGAILPENSGNCWEGGVQGAGAGYRVRSTEYPVLSAECWILSAGASDLLFVGPPLGGRPPKGGPTDKRSLDLVSQTKVECSWSWTGVPVIGPRLWASPSDL